MNKGFTLIETIIYIALFAIVIGGGMVATYNIIESTNAGTNHVVLQEEANFLLRKINWALTGATSICSTGSKLVITKITPVSCPTSANLISFDLNGSNIIITKGTSSPVILNSSSITVLALSFALTTIGTGVKTQFTLTTVQNGRKASQIFSTTKYLRQ